MNSSYFTSLNMYLKNKFETSKVEELKLLFLIFLLKKG
jgi:hypothetical protein